MATVRFDENVGNLLLRYARMIVARGYVHNSLGNLAIRVPHPDFEHGVAYTKHAEVSLEEMTQPLLRPVNADLSVYSLMALVFGSSRPSLLASCPLHQIEPSRAASGSCGREPWVGTSHI